MGVLPLLFDKCNFNRKIHKAFLKKKSLFQRSLFSMSKNDNVDLPNYIKNKELYSKSIIVGDFEAKNSLENLEFIIGKQTLEEDQEFCGLNRKDSLIN